jgi:hypothetical protein
MITKQIPSKEEGPLASPLESQPTGRIFYQCGCWEDNLNYTYELCPKHDLVAKMEWFP